MDRDSESADADADRDQLEARIEQLEATVSKMLPSRRDAIRMGAMGVAGAGVGAAGMRSASEPAAAAPGDTVGTPDDRIDWYANLIDANTIETEDANMTRIGETNVEQNVTDVGSSRSLDTTYQNNSESTWYLFVKVTATADGTSVIPQLVVSSDSTEMDGDREVDNFNMTLDNTQYVSLTGIVPPGYFWRINSYGDTADYNIDRVKERRFIP